MDEWDADDFEPVLPAVPAAAAPKQSKWEGEDEEEEPVKEDKDEISKPVEKEKKKKKKDKAAVVLDPENALLDPVEEKLRQQRLVEEADYKATQELFKGTSGAAKSIDDFIPKTLADFQALGELVAAKVTPFEKSLHYMELLKAFLRAATGGINSEKVKELGASVTVIANNKLKDEKAAHGEGKKKKTSAAKGKKSLHLDAEEDNLNVEADDGWDGAEDGYDDGYDFM